MSVKLLVINEKIITKSKRHYLKYTTLRGSRRLVKFVLSLRKVNGLVHSPIRSLIMHELCTTLVT